MSKIASYLSDVHATLIGMYDRQQLYIDRKAAEEAKKATLKPEVVITAIKEEEAAAREDLTALHVQLVKRANRVVTAADKMIAE